MYLERIEGYTSLLSVDYMSGTNPKHWRSLFIYLSNLWWKNDFAWYEQTFVSPIYLFYLSAILDWKRGS